MILKPCFWFLKLQHWTDLFWNFIINEQQKKNEIQNSWRLKRHPTVMLTQCSVDGRSMDSRESCCCFTDYTNSQSGLIIKTGINMTVSQRDHWNKGPCSRDAHLCFSRHDPSKRALLTKVCSHQTSRRRSLSSVEVSASVPRLIYSALFSGKTVGLLTSRSLLRCPPSVPTLYLAPHPCPLSVRDVSRTLNPT